MAHGQPAASLVRLMNYRWLLIVAPLLVALVWCSAAAGPEESSSDRQLRVCADPNNLPFSNQRLEGFENRLADLIAAELHRTVQYTWWAQRRGFFRNTLRAGVCDIVLGVPHHFDLALTTRPYYRSTYVFVSRHDRGLNIHSFDDPRLRQVKIGVQLIGDDYTNTPPPAHALASHKIIGNVVGYPIYGNYAEDSPPARIIEAVAAGDPDVAVVWGPLAGYFATNMATASFTSVRNEADLHLSVLHQLPHS